ncbi:L-fucose:H+ symporter permease [Pedobacter antarcticus]|uniref:L-fucose:H+ symporter permease n=1 Tax=Pedobacter antarcticus TaxID=34086 RepID=UPI001C59FDBC|nr:L-fucose:H+ symporter permease [Pedobacter antarcticus]
MKNKAISNLFVPLAVVISLMFFWNFCRNINDILIPHLKRSCQLNDFESSLVQSAFFGAYFLISLPAGYFIGKYGYRNGMIVGLLCAALGAALFYPAAITRDYPLFLGALFIMAAGFTFLEVTVTPYISRLGPEHDASSRLSFAAAVGSLGAVAGPYAGAHFLLSETEMSETAIQQLTPAALETFLNQEAHMVIKPYLILAILFLLVALVVKLIHLPEIKAETLQRAGRLSEVLKSKHTVLGVLAVFAYLGAEVGLVSFFIRYAKSLNIAGLTEKDAAVFISFYMLLVLIGRVSGAYLLKKIQPQQALLFCTVIACLLVVTAFLTGGYLSLYAITAIGLFTAIMYPVIFTLSIKNLGGLTKVASSLLIMGCVGGALVPPLMGYVSDQSAIQYAFLVPLICFVYVGYYAVSGYKSVEKPVLKDDAAGTELKTE